MITYNPVYGRMWEGADPTKGHVYYLASPDPLPPRCQRCGGEIHGWCCQSCPAEFREDDNGNLIFDEGSPDPRFAFSANQDPLLEEAWKIGLPTDQQIAAAIKATEYKYFGDYELREEQWVAVDTLVKAASKLTEVRAFLSKLGRA